MSEYTITIKELQDINFDFGLKDYEIFNEDYRVVLNNSILGYYKFREIGFVMPEMFKDRLNLRMNNIIRNKYNALYEAKQTEFNLLFNVNMTETLTHVIDNVSDSRVNQNGTTNNTQNLDGTIGSISKKTSVQSDYPSNELIEGDLENNDYANGAIVESNNSTDTNHNVNTDENISHAENVGNAIGKTTETYTKTNLGSSAGLPFSRAMEQFKDYLDVFQLDIEIINELKDLFMNIW